jgi:hypothetical protein
LFDYKWLQKYTIILFLVLEVEESHLLEGLPAMVKASNQVDFITSSLLNYKVELGTCVNVGNTIKSIDFISRLCTKESNV